MKNFLKKPWVIGILISWLIFCILLLTSFILSRLLGLPLFFLILIPGALLIGIITGGFQLGITTLRWVMIFLASLIFYGFLGLLMGYIISKIKLKSQTSDSK